MAARPKPRLKAAPRETPGARHRHGIELSDQAFSRSNKVEMNLSNRSEDMRRSLVSTILLLVTAITLSTIPLGARASAQDKLSVRLDFSPWGVQSAMHLAKNKGWFKEANLDVDIQDGRGSGNTIQLVNAGQADVGQVQVGLVGSAR